MKILRVNEIVVLSAVSLSFLAAPLVAFADKVIVNDCQKDLTLVETIEGKTFSLQAILDGASVGNVQSNTTVVLTDKNNSRELSQVAKNGLVTFENIPGGTYEICGKSVGVKFANLSLLDSASADSSSTLAATAVGATAAGALAVVLGGSGDSSSGAEAGVAELSAQTSSGPVLTEKPTSQAASSSRPGSKADENSDCFIGDDENVVPMSPFN